MTDTAGDVVEDGTTTVRLTGVAKWTGGDSDT